MERHIELLTNAIEEEKKKVEASTAAIDEATDADESSKQRREKLREVMIPTGWWYHSER